MFEEEPDLEFLSEEGETFRALELIVALMYPGETDEFIADPELVYGKIGDFTSFFLNIFIYKKIIVYFHFTSFFFFFGKIQVFHQYFLGTQRLTMKSPYLNISLGIVHLLSWK